MTRHLADCAWLCLGLGKMSFTAGALLVAITASSAVHARGVAYASPPEEPTFGTSIWGQPAPQPVPRRRDRTRHYAAPAVQDVRNDVGSFSASGGNSSSILNEASRWIGHGNITGSHRAWCADFANFVLSRTGHRASGSGKVNSMLSLGSRVSSPAQGDLVVMRSHVTIFAGYGGKGFYGIGGNQHHQVAMSNFPLRSVVAFVRPN